MIPDKQEIKEAVKVIEELQGSKDDFLSLEEAEKLEEAEQTALTILKAYDEGTIGEKSQEIIYQKGTIFVGTCPKCKSEVIGNRIRVKLKPLSLKSQKEDK